MLNRSASRFAIRSIDRSDKKTRPILMTYAIVGFGGDGPFRDEITAEELAEIRLSKDTCLVAIELEEKLNLLLDNYYELEVELLKLAEAYRIWPDREHADAMQERLNLDRRIVNLLTSCRLYIDQSKHVASRLFGDESTEFREHVARTHKAYDSQFGYRFMEALRNYVQHRGLLVHSINYGTSRVTHKDGDYFQHTVAPILDLSNLKQDPKFKQSVLEEGLERGKTIDLRGPTREYVSAIWSLHLILRDTINATFSERMQAYRTTAEKYGPSSFARAVTLDKNGSHVDETELPTHIGAYYDALKRKNRILANLPGSYTSSYHKEV
jgi:hypothetical protein